LGIRRRQEVDFGIRFHSRRITNILASQETISTIALSIAEAEYAALTQAAKEAIWLQNLLKDLEMSKYAPKAIHVDNQGAIALAENPIHHARTKHLDVQLQFVRDHVERNTIELQYCPTNDMLADIMTKALARDKHARMCQLIGMDGLLGNTSPSSSEVMSVLGSKEELGIGEWECGNTPLPARTMLVAYAIR
jgi:hypothetical protein